MRRAVLAAALLVAGCAQLPELHVHWERARVAPAVLSYTTDDGGVIDDPNWTPTLRDHIRSTPVGLRLTVPFDLGWPGPPDGPRWVRDPGHPTGPYSSPKPSTGVEAKVNRGCAEYERLHLAITIAEHFAVSAEHRAIVDKAKAVADAACEGDAATVKQRVARAIVELGTILEQGK